MPREGKSAAAEDFWRFSGDFYARPGIATLCLALQDKRNRDVNLLLFCLWLGKRGQKLDAALLATIAARASPWRRTILQSLRKARRRLVARYPHFKADALALELAAEKIAQSHILTGYREAGGSLRVRAVAKAEKRACAAANLRLYLGDAAEARLILAALSLDP